MPHITDIIGLAGISLALAATVLLFSPVRRLSPARIAALLAAIVIILLAPIGTLPLAAYVRGATGDLSVVGLVLISSAVLRCLTGWPAPNRRSHNAMLGFVSIAALALYPMALGIGMFDPYRLGYASPWLFVALFVVALSAWFARAFLLAVCLGLAALAWSLRWYESTNLWDYLLDPLVSLYALGSLAIRALAVPIRLVRGSSSRVRTSDSTQPV
jgi:hypothetical protein